MARLGAVTIPQVELQACEQGREPAAIHQQVPVLIVSERLGHATVQITLDTYSHVIPGLDEQAATTVA